MVICNVGVTCKSLWHLSLDVYMDFVVRTSQAKNANNQTSCSLVSLDHCKICLWHKPKPHQQVESFWLVYLFGTWDIWQSMAYFGLGLVLSHCSSCSFVIFGGTCVCITGHWFACGETSRQCDERHDYASKLSGQTDWQSNVDIVDCVRSGSIGVIGYCYTLIHHCHCWCWKWQTATHDEWLVNNPVKNIVDKRACWKVNSLLIAVLSKTTTGLVSQWDDEGVCQQTFDATVEGHVISVTWRTPH